MAISRYTKSSPYGDFQAWTEREFEAVERSSASIDRAVTAAITSVTTATLGTWIQVKKTADEARASTTTLADDGVLKFTMPASTKYAIRASIFFDSDVTPDFSWALAGPSTPTRVAIKRSWIVPGDTAYTGIAIDAAATARQDIQVPGTQAGWIHFDAIWHNGANAGTFAFQWAQRISDATAANVRAGSYLEYMVT